MSPAATVYKPMMLEITANECFVCCMLYSSEIVFMLLYAVFMQKSAA